MTDEPNTPGSDVLAGEFLAGVAASGPRRIFGVTVLAALGFVLLWVVFTTPPATMGFSILLLVGGVGALFGAERMWRATERSLILTTEVLGDDSGKVFATFDEMERVERGMMAFKPSNGFVLTLKTKGQSSWAPGLYWKMGRRIGVGGVTAAAQAKIMADVIALRLAERDGD